MYSCPLAFQTFISGIVFNISNSETGLKHLRHLEANHIENTKDANMVLDGPLQGASDRLLI
jgi:hypothetical protein